MSGALLVIVFLMLFIMVVGVLALLFRKPPQELADLSTKAAVITEKIERVEAIPNEVNALKVELGRLSERVAGVEQNQNNVNQSVGNLSTTLARILPRSAPNRRCRGFCRSDTRTRWIENPRLELGEDCI